MATLRIAFKDGKFVCHNGVNVKTFTEKNLEANGWLCEINSAGKFICSATYICDGIKHQTKIILDNGGLIKTKRREERSRPKYNWFKLKKTPAEGIIFLPSISIDMRPRFSECSIEGFCQEYQ